MRNLPFRQTKNPYKIWLSEIILQQTRVEQGLPYYEKFIKLFPEISDLANAGEDKVLKAWQGLGYYSRARNLHATAMYVVNELNGVFPVEYNELIKLKGIGDYTASAISSLVGNEVSPALDGNVYRFVSRLFGIDIPINTPKSIKEFKTLLMELIDHEKPGEFNQAMIEFGALHCVPKSPDCVSCVFNDSCQAYVTNRIDELPVKLKKKKSIDRFLIYYAVFEKEYTYIYKRKENKIWKNLYEFPFIESKNIYEEETIISILQNSGSIMKVYGPFRHILSHQNINAKLIVMELISVPDEIPDEWIKISKNKLINYPVHRLMEKMIQSADLKT